MTTDVVVVLVLKELLLMTEYNELCLYWPEHDQDGCSSCFHLGDPNLTIQSGFQVTTDHSQCTWRVSGRGHVIDQLFGITHLKIPTLFPLLFEIDGDMCGILLLKIIVGPVVLTL